MRKLPIHISIKKINIIETPTTLALNHVDFKQQLLIVTAFINISPNYNNIKGQRHVKKLTFNMGRCRRGGGGVTLFSV